MPTYRYLMFHGQPQPLGVVARVLGLSGPALARRIAAWGLDRALTTPKVTPPAPTRMAEAIAAYYDRHPDETPPGGARMTDMAMGYGLPPRPAPDHPQARRYQLTHDGRTQSLHAWAEESPVSYAGFVRRLATMSLAKALTTPRPQRPRAWWQRRDPVTKE